MAPTPEAIRRELAPGEQVLWSGHPRQGVVFRAADLYLVPFSLIWGGFSMVWEYQALTTPGDPAFRLYGIPFVVMGLHLIVGRFFVEARQRAATSYAVTTDRVLIVSGLFHRRVQSLPWRAITDLTLTEGATHGSILFGGGSPPVVSFRFSPNFPGMNPGPGPQFDLIANARSVYQLIRDRQRATVAAG